MQWLVRNCQTGLSFCSRDASQFHMAHLPSEGSWVFLVTMKGLGGVKILQVAVPYLYTSSSTWNRQCTLFHLRISPKHVSMKIIFFLESFFLSQSFKALKKKKRGSYEMITSSLERLLLVLNILEAKVQIFYDRQNHYQLSFMLVYEDVRG